MDLGTQLKTYRKSKKHSVQKVSELTGIPADRIYKWEKGTRPSDAEDLLKIREYMAGKVETAPEPNGKLETPAAGTPLTGAAPTLQDYINEIKAQRDMFYALLSSNLGNLQEGQRTLLAYQKAWVDQFAEKESRGDPDKKAEIMYRVNKLVDDILTDVSLSGTQTGIGTRSRG